MGQLVQLTSESKAIANLFTVNKQRMVRAAPKGFDPDRLLSIAFNAIAYNTDLLQCSQQSLIGGVFETLKMGLTIGGPMQEAWLIPFNSNKSPTGKEATLIVGYMGYRNLIDRAKATLDLHPRAVHNGVGRAGGKADDFDYVFGSNPNIQHRPHGPAPENEKQLRAVYVVARLRGGGLQFEVLEKEEVDQHRNRSRAKSNGPWVTDYVPMGLKTGIRKIAKYLPKATLEMARALDLDEKADMGQDQEFDIEGLVIDQAPSAGPQPQQRLNAVKEQLRAEQGKPAPEQGKPAAGELKAEDINFGGEGGN